MSANLSDSWIAAGKSHKVLAAILVKITFYYVIVFGLIAVLTVFFVTLPYLFVFLAMAWSHNTKLIKNVRKLKVND